MREGGRERREGGRKEDREGREEIRGETRIGSLTGLENFASRDG